jgi:iron complex outermembrane receptor protein
MSRKDNSQFSASVFRINQTNIATKEEPTDPYRSIGKLNLKGWSWRQLAN